METKNTYKWHTVKELPRYVKRVFGFYCPESVVKPCFKHGLFYHQHSIYVKGTHYEYKVISNVLRHGIDGVVRRELIPHKFKYIVKGFPENNSESPIIAEQTLIQHSWERAYEGAHIYVSDLNRIYKRKKAGRIRWKLISVAKTIIPIVLSPQKLEMLENEEKIDFSMIFKDV